MQVVEKEKEQEEEEEEPVAAAMNFTVPIRHSLGCW